MSYFSTFSVLWPHGTPRTVCNKTNQWLLKTTGMAMSLLAHCCWDSVSNHVTFLAAEDYMTFPEKKKLSWAQNVTTVTKT